ncbi:hypothetical protein LCGC14_1409700 [marine sediment metagenome]|uniref:Uncharacterized protein n=1 Tax=marine sediment metagenome TaxID=412755 RepID=A0A0F9MW99_9ZZZZ
MLEVNIFSFVMFLLSAFFFGRASKGRKGS